MKKLCLSVVLAVVAMCVTSASLMAAPFTPLPGNGVTTEWCDIHSAAKSGKGTLLQRIDLYNKQQGCFFYMFFTFGNELITVDQPLVLEKHLTSRDANEPNNEAKKTGVYIRGTGTEVEPLNITLDGRTISGSDCVIKIKEGFSAKHQVHGLTIIARDKYHAICDDNNQDLLGKTSPNCPGSLTGEQCEFSGNTIVALSNDSDGDGISDSTEAAQGTDPTTADTDSDGDNDKNDNCPTTSNADQANADGDTQGDACDSDDDNDGILDATDNCPLVSNNGQLNTGGDPKGDACDGDDDGDTVADDVDNCPLAANTDQANADADTEGDVCDADDDNDTIPDATDNCKGTASTDLTDTDGDGEGNPCDTDDDGDTVADASDNCPLVANTDQANADSDAQGDACDATNPPPDSDGDGILNALDKCPDLSSPDNIDTDADGQGNPCDADDDGDGTADADDCAPLDAAKSTPAQCNPPAGQDTDADGLPDSVDLCASDLGPATNGGCPATKCIAQDGTVKDKANVDVDADGIDQACDMNDNQATPPPADADADGLPDSVDLCDSDAGIASNGGCPAAKCIAQDGTVKDKTGTDADADGIDAACDVNDNLADPAAVDADADGLPDSVDLCDSDAGIASNGGCPAAKCIAQDGTVKDKANVDADADGIDQACDANDTVPAPGSFVDTDGDGINDATETTIGTDATKADTDGDGVNDPLDCAAKDATKKTAQDCAAATLTIIDNDPDKDGICNPGTTTPANCTMNADNTGDNCPFAANSNQVDGDHDGIGDICDLSPSASNNLSDTDNDGVPDQMETDIFGTDPSKPDSDGDGLSDGAEVTNPFYPLCGPSDPDCDDDGVCDGAGTVTDSAGNNICAPVTEGQADNCPLASNGPNTEGITQEKIQQDSDANGIGDACENDLDGDTVQDNLDNCPMVPNEDQADTDANGIGDACDPAFSGSVTGGGGCGCRMEGQSSDSPANMLVLMSLGLPLFVMRAMRKRA